MYCYYIEYFRRLQYKFKYLIDKINTIIYNGQEGGICMLKALCTAEFDPKWAEKAGELVRFQRVGFSLDLNPASRMDEKRIAASLQGYDIFFCGYEKVTRQVLEACPELKLILSVRDGPEENIDVAACTQMGIPVLFSGGRCERSVPEFTLLAMLLMAKPALRSAQVIRAEGWTKENDLCLRRICEASTELAGKTLGIVGLGRNGRGVAKRAAGFEMEMMAYDPYAPPEKARELGVKLCALEEVLSSADYLVMAARVTQETRGMIGAGEFARMKDGACFINAARAALADSGALLEQLRSGRLRAALDVFDEEPVGPASPWYSIPEDRLLMTSHLAGLSVERVVYQSEMLCGLLSRFLEGEAMERGVCNPQVWDCPAFEGRGGTLYGCRRGKGQTGAGQ